MWTVGLTLEIKLRFRDRLARTVGLTVQIKLHFCDGLVWTVGLTVEIKLRYQISPVYCGRGLTEGLEEVKWKLDLGCFYPGKMGYK